MTGDDLILTLNETIGKVSLLKKQGRRVVLCHGVFDVLHPGVVEHLERARAQGDVLVVTVVSDRGLGARGMKTLFPQQTRLKNVAALRSVDFLCPVDEADADQVAARIGPDLLVKGIGRDRGQQKDDRGGKKRAEKVSSGGEKIQVLETKGFLDDGTSVLTDFVHVYPRETRLFLRRFAARHPFAEIKRIIDEIQDLKILLVGDGIIDEYHSCESLGKSAKANLVVSRYLSHEVYAGGAFAVANHLAGICRQVDLVTVLGEADSREEFVRKTLKPNVGAIFFTRRDGPTVIKKRYLDRYFNQKLFEVNYLNDAFIDRTIQKRILGYLQSHLREYDLILIADFGHGLVTPPIAAAILKQARRVAVNTQTNAANVGYNMITKYRGLDYVCLAEQEVRLAAQDKFSPIAVVIERMLPILKTGRLMVTLGKSGSIGITADGTVEKTPVFSSKVVDTVGAGDAFFAFTAPCAALDPPLDVIGFVGNVVGAIAVQIMGNQRPVEKEEFLELAAALLR